MDNWTSAWTEAGREYVKVYGLPHNLRCHRRGLRRVLEGEALDQGHETARRTQPT
ncbi:MAG: hypothetical protein R3D59_17285 [Paracoccaceae bacterium]